MEKWYLVGLIAQRTLVQAQLLQHMKKVDSIVLLMWVLIYVALFFGASCKTIKQTNTTATNKVDSVNVVVNNTQKVSDSTVVQAASSLSLEFELLVDSNRIVAPFGVKLNKGSNHVYVASRNNKITIYDSSGAVISRFKSELNSKDSALAQLKLWAVMNATNNTEIVFRMPTWAWCIMLSEALLIILLLIILKVK